MEALIRFALRNVLRHRKRTSATVAAIVFGVAALILSRGFIDDTFDQLAEALIHSQTVHLQLARTGYFEHGAQEPEKYLLPSPDADRREIAALPEVADVAARLRFSGLINNGHADYAILGEGVEAMKE